MLLNLLQNFISTVEVEARVFQSKFGKLTPNDSFDSFQRLFCQPVASFGSTALIHAASFFLPDGLAGQENDFEDGLAAFAWQGLLERTEGLVPWLLVGLIRWLASFFLSQLCPRDINLLFPGSTSCAFFHFRMDMGRFVQLSEAAMALWA